MATIRTPMTARQRAAEGAENDATGSPNTITSVRRSVDAWELKDWKALPEPFTPNPNTARSLLAVPEIAWFENLTNLWLALVFSGIIRPRSPVLGLPAMGPTRPFLGAGFPSPKISALQAPRNPKGAEERG
ncbi:hypothetical protein ACJJTC_018007 [Scirpophaga incertulas]